MTETDEQWYIGGLENVDNQYYSLARDPIHHGS